jgi:uncharacterized membrane protein YfcA
LDATFFTIACVIVGAVAGLLGGLLGIGGGIVIVPSLILLFDRVHLFEHAPTTATLVAVGTSLGSIVFTATAAARAQIRARMVEWIVVRRWTIGLMVGGYASGFVAAALPLTTLRVLIGAFLAFVSTVMLTSWRPSPHRALPGAAASSAIAGTAGLVSGMAGIGGGNVIVPTLVFHNVPVHRATATSSALGFPVALSGALGYIVRGWHDTTLANGFLGYLYLPALAALVVSSMLTAPLGVRLAHRTSPAPLRKAFGALLALVSIQLLVSALR